MRIKWDDSPAVGLYGEGPAYMFIPPQILATQLSFENDSSAINFVTSGKSLTLLGFLKVS